MAPLDTHDDSDRDALLRKVLPAIAARHIAAQWSRSRNPYADLVLECRSIAASPATATTFAAFLRAHPVIPLSVHSMLSQFAFVASLRPEQVPMPQRLLAPNGWRIARWLPTFLLIDGPLGFFFRHASSPLHSLLAAQHSAFPVLSQVRDAFNSELFMAVRRGVGHWAFACETRSAVPHLICYHWKSGAETAALTFSEAEALHLLAFSAIEGLDQHVFRPLGGDRPGAGA